MLTDEEKLYLSQHLLGFRSDEPLLQDRPESTTFSYLPGANPTAEDSAIEGFFLKFPRWKTYKSDPVNERKVVQITLLSCGHCGSTKIHRANAWENDVEQMGPHGEYTRPSHQLYECEDCHQLL